jgi:hypothetical protein
VVDGLRADESLRTSLPFGHQGRLAEAVDVVLDVLRNASADSDLAAAAVSAKLARDTRPEALRPLAQTQAAAEVTASSRVRWRAGLHLLADQVALPDRRVDVPPDDAVRVLLLGEPVAVIDLPGDLNANLELVCRLLAEAVLVPAD